MTPGRRAFTRAIVAGAGLASLPRALAQDPRVSTVAAAARDWLAIVDRGDAQASHAAAGEKFRTKLTRDAWSAALAKERTPRGPLLQRGVVQTNLEPRIPGVPAGDYAVLVFRTAFERQTVAGETVTLEREKDGRWRVIGYFIQ